MSEIASSDWPDEWPNLLDSLVQLLNSGSTDNVHGAMRVLSDFVSTDLSEDQLLPLSNAMLPQLLQILGDERVSWEPIAQSCLGFIHLTIPVLVFAYYPRSKYSSLSSMRQHSIYGKRKPSSSRKVRYGVRDTTMGCSFPSDSSE